SPSVFRRGASGSDSNVFWLLISIVLSGLLGLSIVPHQEARFLSPLLLPLLLIYTWKQPKLSTSFWIVWAAFNIIATYVFGVVHQGGVVPAMSFLNYQTSGIQNCYILENKGLACSLRGQKDSGNHTINLLDFSSRREDLLKKLEQCSGVVLHKVKPGEIEFAETSRSNTYERTLFITPSFVDLPKVIGRRYMLVASFSPHISFDDMDKMISRAEKVNSLEAPTNLNVFLLLSDKGINL
ncbi:hypothetical protein BY458DRAFT_444889, partial [Sporodiniella umbellata]